MAFDPSNRPGSADHDVFALNREVEALDDRTTALEAGGGGGGVKTLTVTHTDADLTAAALTQTIAVGALPASAVLLAHHAKLTTPMAGGGATTGGFDSGPTGSAGNWATSAGFATSGLDNLVTAAANAQAAAEPADNFSVGDGNTGVDIAYSSDVNLNTITSFGITHKFLYIEADDIT